MQENQNLENVVEEVKEVITETKEEANKGALEGFKEKLTDAGDTALAIGVATAIGIGGYVTGRIVEAKKNAKKFDADVNEAKTKVKNFREKVSGKISGIFKKHKKNEDEQVVETEEVKED